MRSIYSTGIKAKILFYLRNYGPTKRASFISIFSEYYKQSVQREILELLQKGLIEQVKRAPKPSATPVRYLQLTDAGRSAITQLEDEHGEQEANKDLATIKRDERKELVMRVYNACRATGVLVEKDKKPALEVLFGIAPAHKDEEEKIQEMFRAGAYYSVTEIRATARKAFGDGPLNQTRCVGVVIRGHRIYFVYNMGGKLIYFNATTERKTRDGILGLFEKSEIMRSHIQFGLKREAPCILFGNSYGTVPQLFFKRKGGALPVDDEGKEIVRKGNWEPNRDRISMSILGDLFTEVYFVPSKDIGIVFEALTRMTPDLRDRLVEKWVSDQPALRMNDDPSSMAQAVEKKTGHPVFIWVDNDLKTLHEVWKKKASAYVVVLESGPENAIAKVMGTRLLSVQTVKGEVLTTRRYDDFGNPVK